MASIMVQGTTSSAGKSIISTALCRIFKEDGYKVAPFKSQNMSTIYYETGQGYKMSTAQALQALAAGIDPHPSMNPILLLPRSDTGSKIVVKGEFYNEMEAKEYLAHRNSMREMITRAYRGLEEENQIMVLEGAGSPAEINLKENDIVNMGMAEIAAAPVVLVGDIDRGGIFAHFYGTVMLLEEDERARIKGLIINKFRGDRTLLNTGINMIEELLNIPVVGTIPYIGLNLLDEGSLVTRAASYKHGDLDLEKLEEEITRLAKIVRDNLDMAHIYSLLELDS